MCRYTFINYKEDQIIVSIKEPSSNDNDDEEDTGKKPRIFSFNHEKVKHFYSSPSDQFVFYLFQRNTHSVLRIISFQHVLKVPFQLKFGIIIVRFHYRLIQQ
jgi:hypothetical protein